MSGINEALKIVRTMHGVTQAEMSKLTGRSKPSVCQSESGIQGVSLSIVKQYAEVFGVRTSDILRFSELVEHLRKKNNKTRERALQKEILIMQECIKLMSEIINELHGDQQQYRMD